MKNQVRTQSQQNGNYRRIQMCARFANVVVNASIVSCIGKHSS